MEIVFYALIVMGLVIIGQFFVPLFQDFFRGTILFLLPFLIFSSLGGALIFFTLKKKTKSRLKIFLLITGISSAGFFVCVVLHNLFYALGVLSSSILVLKYLMGFLHAAFFLVGVIGCPIGFLVGVIGSLVLMRKKKGLLS